MNETEQLIVFILIVMFTLWIIKKTKSKFTDNDYNTLVTQIGNELKTVM